MFEYVHRYIGASICACCCLACIVALHSTWLKKVGAKYGSSFSFFRHLRARDLNSMAQQVTSNVLTTEISDEGYVPAEDELNLQQLILGQLKADRLSSSQFLSQDQWHSVFWDPSFARPDIIMDLLKNTAVQNVGMDRSSWDLDKLDQWKKSNEQNWNVMLDYFQAKNGACRVNYELSCIFGENEQELQDVDFSLTNVQLEQWARDHEINIELKGGIYRVKPVELYRLNLRSLQQRGEILSKRVQVRRVTIQESLQVGVAENTTLELIAEQHNAIRKDVERTVQSFQELEGRMEEYMHNLWNVTKEKFSDAADALKQVVIQQQRQSLSKIEHIESRLNELQMSTGALSSFFVLYRVLMASSVLVQCRGLSPFGRIIFSNITF